MEEKKTADNRGNKFNQKLKPYMVLQYLLKYTDEDHLVTAKDIVDALQLYGKKAVYEICIPKGDAHTWEDCRVDFFGESFRVFGIGKEYIDANIPLDWNKKYKVERYE